MKIHEIFRIPYGYQESTYIESKKNIIIQRLEQFLTELEDNFNSEIDGLKKEDKIINERIDNISVGDVDLDMGTFIYEVPSIKTMKKKKTFKSELI